MDTLFHRVVLDKNMRSLWKNFFDPFEQHVGLCSNVRKMYTSSASLVHKRARMETARFDPLYFFEFVNNAVFFLRLSQDM